MQTVMASRNAVENFLEKIGLERYGTRFLTQGYDRIIDLCILDEEDLDSLSIRERDDRFKILDAGKYLFRIFCLPYVMLEHREIGFVPLVLFSFRFIPFLRRMRIYLRR